MSYYDLGHGFYQMLVAPMRLARMQALRSRHPLTPMPSGRCTPYRLDKNRKIAEQIFSRIHAPAEFSGLGSNWTTLVRKSGGKAKLTEVSTGQRSAFALSIFLAPNAQLRTAPPIMLIADPVAHVDDLNVLSFLDYLREIAISGERQIFFATADEKLAALFERKFDFLGAEFQKFNLRRPLTV